LAIATKKFELERAELDAVLASGKLGRANNLVRLLTYVCEKYFEGGADELKEYCIAVHALGRSEDFDPQVDTIVRVTAHTLRKRLEDYYRTTGAEHPVHIYLPPGGYAPTFARRDEAVLGENGQELSNPAAWQPHNIPVQVRESQLALTGILTADAREHTGTTGPRNKSRSTSRVVYITGSVAILLGCLAVFGLYLLKYKVGGTHIQRTEAVTPAGFSGGLRVLIGEGRKPYTDEAGFSWESDRFCSGGDSFTLSKSVIHGTDDPQLFLGGRRGAFHCQFPLPAGTYEVHLLFAETAGLMETARTMGYLLNGKPTINLDVVDDAGEGDTATTKVHTDVESQADGSIHLDFTTPDSFLNAVEILPGNPQHMLPVRILAGRTSAYRDPSGALWLPDRDYFGGRPSKIGNDVSKLPDAARFDGQRIGHFHYAIPVSPGGEYTLKLYFIERWFGIQNRNVGGVGSRIFDVSCNGTTLLKNFDIMAEGGGPLVKSFPHIKPTAQGKIEIYFIPNVNYPSVNAIEVIPE
jgi:hypothetical protein